MEWIAPGWFFPVDRHFTLFSNQRTTAYGVYHVPRNTTKSEKAFYRDLGRNLAMARGVASKSQMETADQVAVSFQQLQKWEKGSNRVPVRELTLIASYLGAPLTDLLGTDHLTPANSPLRDLLERLPDKEFQQALKAWADLKDPRLKSAVVDFINALAAISS